MKSIEHLKLFIQKDPDLYIDEFKSHIEYVTNLLSVEQYEELSPSINLIHHCLSGMILQVDFSILLNALFQNINSFDSSLKLSAVQLFVKYSRIAHQKNLTKKELPVEIEQTNPILWYWEWSFNHLLKITDKSLRRYLLNVLLNDITLHKGLQSQFLAIMQPYLDTTQIDAKEFSSEGLNSAKYGLRILMQGIHSKIFTSKLAFHLLTSCVFHPVISVAMSSTQFILKPSKFFASTIRDDEEEDEMQNKELLKQQTNELKRLNHLAHVSKSATKKSGQRLNARLKKSIKKHQKILGKDDENDYVSESHTLIRLISNTYEFYDRIYKLCMVSSGASRLTTAHRDLKLRLIARCIYVHKMFCQQYYTLLLKWMHPHMPSCPNALHCLMESIHDQVPVEWIKPCIKAIADRFVVESQGDDRMTVGLGVIKSIAERNTRIFEPEHFEDMEKDQKDFTRELAGPDLLSDLCMYSKYKTKSVVSASRTLLNFYREYDPELLPIKMRGRQEAEHEEEDEIEDEEEDIDAESQSETESVDFYEYDPEVEQEDNVEASFKVGAITAEEQENARKKIKDKNPHSHTRKKKAEGASLSESQKRKRKNTMMMLHGGKMNGKKKRKFQ
eukprot:NODE_282_length_10822_cov_1.088035.p2 type:complete len:615 gc:universal NODE_282_length_10822_cov_1.088035:3846-5690(+)